MALPTKEKTWQHLVNRAVGGTGVATTDNRSYLLSMKNALKAFGSSPWMVWGSRSWDGSSGSLDGSGGGNDFWTNTTLMAFGGVGSNHAWIVLTQPGLAASGKAALCIDLTYLPYSNAGITVVLSPYNGFGAANGGADGTGTNRPTATDQIILGTDAEYGGYNGTWASNGLHVMQSSDGQCTRVVLCRGGYVESFWLFDRVAAPCSAWSNPVACEFRGHGGTTDMATSYANYNDAAGVHGQIGYTYLTSEGYGSATLGENITVPDDDTAEFALSPMYHASGSFGYRGSKKGRMYDLWWGSTGVATGDCYPGDGSRTFAQFGHMVFPWDGSTPLIT